MFFRREAWEGNGVCKGDTEEVWCYGTRKEVINGLLCFCCCFCHQVTLCLELVIDLVFTFSFSFFKRNNLLFDYCSIC